MDTTPLDAYMNVVLRSNPETFMEARKMAEGMTFEEVFTKAGIIPEWIERGWKKGREEGREEGLEEGRDLEKAEIARGLLAKGWSVEDTAEITMLPLEKVRGLFLPA